MFISSYNTNIHVNSNDKVSKERFERDNTRISLFSSKLNQPVQDSKLLNFTSKIDYISTPLALSNKQLLEEQKNNSGMSKNSDLKSYAQRNSLINAKNAYEENSKIFSLFQIPSVTLDKTPKLEQTLPEEPKEIKELHLRAKMVNTYIANDNYYKITA